MLNEFRHAKSGFRPGVIIYWLYYAPRGFVRKVLRRGIVEYLIDYQAQKVMEKAAARIPSQISAEHSVTRDVYLLSGNRFWYQTCFCLYSLIKHSNINIRPVIYDDGTLTKKQQGNILKIFPKAKIVSSAEAETALDSAMPKSKFPYLRELRTVYPNIKKLTDIHAGSVDWKLVLDSDMLFFQKPARLLTWLVEPKKPCYMSDCDESYGYPKGLMRSLTGFEIPDRVNVGICGLNSSHIKWDDLERWYKTLLGSAGTSYLQEQALIAMFLSGKQCEVLMSDEYIAKPSLEEAVHPKAVAHHYVAESRPLLFRYGWRHLLP